MSDVSYSSLSGLTLDIQNGTIWERNEESEGEFGRVFHINIPPASLSPKDKIFGPALSSAFVVSLKLEMPVSCHYSCGHREKYNV